MVVEDDLIIREGISKIIRGLNKDINIFSATSGKEAYTYLKDNHVDCFLLDINIDDYSGIELAKKIREIDEYVITPIIFITAEYKYEMTAYRDFHSYCYLKKPFSKEELEKLLDKVLNKGIIKNKEKDSIQIKTKKINYIIELKDVLFIERINRKTNIQMKNEIVEINQSLNSIEEVLNEELFRCHRSYIVNRNYIEKIDKSKSIIYLKGDFKVPIGIRYRDIVFSWSQIIEYKNAD